MSSLSLNGIYHRYQTKRFPRLLNDENVPIEDKNKIGELLKKPWNPYIRRHTGIDGEKQNETTLMNIN